jgi:hypothetical protein
LSNQLYLTVTFSAIPRRAVHCHRRLGALASAIQQPK